jgi:hypothetical protein
LRHWLLGTWRSEPVRKCARRTPVPPESWMIITTKPDEKISRNENPVLVHAACIGGVRISRPNFNDRGGRMKL